MKTILKCLTLLGIFAAGRAMGADGNLINPTILHHNGNRLAKNLTLCVLQHANDLRYQFDNQDFLNAIRRVDSNAKWSAGIWTWIWQNPWWKQNKTLDCLDLDKEAKEIYDVFCALGKIYGDEKIRDIMLDNQYKKYIIK